MTTQLLSKKRFDALPSVQYIKQKLDIGKAIKKLLLKYFKREMKGRGINTMPKEEGYKFIPLYDYYRWQDTKAINKNSLAEWKKELFDNYENYHNPLNSVYIRIGRHILDKAITQLLKYPEDDRREILYGRGTSVFMLGVDFVDRFRRFGKELTKIGFKYNKEGIMSIFKRPKPGPAPEPEEEEITFTFPPIPQPSETIISERLPDVLGTMLQRAELEREVQSLLNEERKAIQQQREELSALKRVPKEDKPKSGRITEIDKLIINGQNMAKYEWKAERLEATENEKRRYEELKKEGFGPLSYEQIEQLYEELSKTRPVNIFEADKLQEYQKQFKTTIPNSKKAMGRLREALRRGEFGRGQEFDEEDIKDSAYELFYNYDRFTEDDKNFYEQLVENTKKSLSIQGSGITFTDFVRFYNRQPKGTSATAILNKWANQILHTDYKNLAKYFDDGELYSIYLANQLAHVLTQQRERLKKFYGNFPS